MKSHEQNSNHESDNFATLVREAVAGEALPASDPSLREALLKRLDQPAVEPALKKSMADRRRTFFQRAGIALASTAALALVGVIWQRPALERAIGMNTPSSAVQSKALEEDELQLPVLLSNRSRLGQGLGSGRGSGDRPEDEVDTTTYLSRVDRNAKAGESTQLGSRQFASNPGIQDTNPGFQHEGSTAEPWGDGVKQGQAPDYARALPRTDPRALPPVSRSAPPLGNVAPPAATPAPVVPGILPASQPAGPAGLTPSSESGGYGGIAGRPVSGREARLPERGESSTTRHHYAAPEPKPDLNRPVNRLPASPGEPGKYYLETTDKRLEALKSEVDELQTFKKMLKQTEDRTIDAPSVAAVTTAPAKGPDADNSPQKNEPRDLAEAKDRWLLAKLKDAEFREKLEGEELARRAKVLKDQTQAEGQGTFSFYFGYTRDTGGEQYARIVENQFQIPNTEDTALSTFAIDVDTASYANVRRFLTSGQLPPPDAVRLEELVNYFKYQYPQPKGDDPFSVSTEMADCPWQPGHKLLRVGVQGKEIHRQERPASNIVFLIDTSGSMTDQNKLPLLKQAFTMLVGELNENDKVTIVTYAGNAGLKLPPTRGHEKETIIAAIDSLQSGGSTHGSAGISLAYEVAAAQFIKGGTNKVILATDGDLNVGITDDAALVDLITKKAKSGVYLTVLGVGTGNLKDAKMERLADNGNGIYAYLDTVKEARKVLVEEMSGSLVTIAKDVKIQLEFNPNYVHSYRLLGYENRVMANEDFRNDAKDAGEIGAGHSVTAMYEIVLADGAKKSPEPKAEAKPTGEELEFQRFETKKSVLTEAGKSDKVLTVRLRYKTPEATENDKAKELKFPVTDKGGSFNSASKEFQFASSVVAFGLALRNSEYRGSANYSAVAEIASSTLGEDVGGHRAEFVDLVKRAKTLRGE